ncbi:hypothetical protein FB451DRAFT_1182971 [Mycena latifolia]|nr:hypothetical protein FB451DRAFT_1182971 [Mycena latifolia]
MSESYVVNWLFQVWFRIRIIISSFSSGQCSKGVSSMIDRNKGNMQANSTPRLAGLLWAMGMPEVGLKPDDQRVERQSREEMEQDRLNGGEMSEKRKDFASSPGPGDYAVQEFRIDSHVGDKQRRLEEPNLVFEKRGPESRAETK